MNTYAIHEDNMPRLMKKMTRIQNKCKKYGCEFHFAEVGEEYRELKTEDGEKYTARFVLVEAEGRAVVNGWKFIASIQNTEKGNIIEKATDEVEVPERYYTGAPVCEHCGNKRVRNTFLVFNEETGEFKQVGRSCLCDYTHGMSADGVAQYTSAFEELIQGEAVQPGGHYTRYIKVREFMRYAAETIRHFGYVKNDPYSDRKSTRDKAGDFWTLDNGRFWRPEQKEAVKAEYEACGFNPNSPEAVEMVDKALAWLDTQGEDNNYMHNLKTACALEYDNGRNLGIIVSLFPTWNRDLEKQERIKKEQEAGKESEWVGEVGKRISIEIEQVALLTSWETMYGITCVWKIVGKDGNVYTWKTGNDIPEEATKITGTVKEHKEYRGVKQTELTRCRVA